MMAIWVCDCNALNKIHVEAELSTVHVLGSGLTCGIKIICSGNWYLTLRNHSHKGSHATTHGLL